MKKEQCIISCIIVILFCSIVSGCSAAPSNSEVEYKIMKRFPDKDTKGYYRIGTIAIHVPFGNVDKVLKNNKLKAYRENWEKSGVLRSAYYTVSPNYNMKVSLCGVYRTRKFEKIPISKTYYKGIVKVWKDKREGYEGRAYATYKTEFVTDYFWVEFFSGSNAIIKHMDPKSWRRWDASVEEYIDIIRRSVKSEHKCSFRKNSEGNWK